MNIHVTTAAPVATRLPLGCKVQSEGLVYDLVGRNEINGDLLVRFGEDHYWAPAA
jgi:hypothetical protein